ncbi:hypothetical protein GTQ43_16090 [Nostoc sp. KVJ3]|uniref:hypothetical protein n=1 Tax=Nostoc sp. KVJ3 TaxID=457945 RepID=UPI002237DA99|nr:hypothetical protein [Nostoc sp. KVJ3]MCW5315275.1 hypothetical protein [Nostoc sp. KVJ3]
MTIPLFFGDARHSLFIRSWSVPQGRCTDSDSEEGRRLQYSLGFSSIRETAPMELVQSEKIPILGNLAAEVTDKINHSVSLNAVNLQPATYEVFYARS